MEEILEAISEFLGCTVIIKVADFQGIRVLICSDVPAIKEAGLKKKVSLRFDRDLTWFDDDESFDALKEIFDCKVKNIIMMNTKEEYALKSITNSRWAFRLIENPSSRAERLHHMKWVI